MDEKVVTISARISRSYADLIEKHKEIMGGSKTDVLQRALDLLSEFDVASGTNQVTVDISPAILRRAHRLHYDYGYKSSFPRLLEEALESGIRDLLRQYEEDAKRDIEHHRSKLQIETFDMELQTTRSR